MTEPLGPSETEGPRVDYRFTLANERTYLAWVRTSLALLAAGFAVIRFVPGVDLARYTVGVLLLVLGGVLPATSYARWRANDAAMHAGRDLPASRVPALLAVGLTLGAVGALLLVLLG